MCLLFAGAAQAATVGQSSSSGSIPETTALAVALGHGMKPGTGLDVDAQVDKAFDMIRSGKQAKAVRLFDSVIASVDQSLAGDTRARLCRTDRNAGKADADKVVLVEGAVCDAHFGKGFALIDLGRGDLAEVELREATKMAPGNAHYVNEYAELFKSRRQWQKSYDLFAQAWAIVDKDPAGHDASLAARALRGMGYNKIAMGDLDDAERLFRQSQEYEPDNEAARIELGYIARKKAIGS
ncbi:tetratricopeptide repeat protein [Novosphingobium mangrovi (ex Huang et al. 2023)]|uniref:Diguanylate cyclase n=1 Tax=Novosphingobium mangrovi (ex Huang et al. 2023) TaxID=2976432 RepID=A0ABT2I6P6_9SPHN|nr:diguanylate cyclase [Novosphingobium mangrovi (ex Huang et al. 2023)]MCT2400466.1 diguanylate cyclase [Novosphingobium mangrovi (ex Huang et al. 2023)]